MQGRSHPSSVCIARIAVENEKDHILTFTLMATKLNLPTLKTKWLETIDQVMLQVGDIDQ